MELVVSGSGTGSAGYRPGLVGKAAGRPAVPCNTLHLFQSYQVLKSLVWWALPRLGVPAVFYGNSRSAELLHLNDLCILHRHTEAFPLHHFTGICGCSHSAGGLRPAFRRHTVIVGPAILSPQVKQARFQHLPKILCRKNYQATERRGDGIGWPR